MRDCVCDFVAVFRGDDYAPVVAAKWRVKHEEAVGKESSGEDERQSVEDRVV